MRISELAAETGVPLPTVKYYLREGLLPPGRSLSATSADYDDSHVERLRVLRVLREVGAVPVDRLRELVAVTERSGLSTHAVLEAAADALAPRPGPGTPLRELTRDLVDRLVCEAGWTRVRPDSPDRDTLAAAVEAVLLAGTHPPDPDMLRPYVEAVDQLARWEVDQLREEEGPAAVMAEMVVGQVVFGEALLALRRMAEEHYSAVRFEPVTPRPPTGRTDPGPS